MHLEQIGRISRNITAYFWQYLQRKQIRGSFHWMWGAYFCRATFLMRWGLKPNPHYLFLWKEKWCQMIKLMNSHVNILLLCRTHYEASNGTDNIWFPEMQTFEIWESLEAWDANNSWDEQSCFEIYLWVCSITCILNNNSAPVKQWKI